MSNILKQFTSLNHCPIILAVLQQCFSFTTMLYSKKTLFPAYYMRLIEGTADPPTPGSCAQLSYNLFLEIE